VPERWGIMLIQDGVAREEVVEKSNLEQGNLVVCQ
jgi:hypothetical protein